MADVRELHRRMAAQGYLTRGQAMRAGFSDARFTQEVKRSGWERAAWGGWVPARETADHDTLIRVHVETIGPPLLVTGASALFRRGVLDTEPSMVHLLVPLHRSVTPREGARLYHSRTFDEIRFTNDRGLRLAAVTRALADYAADASYKDVCFAIAAALRLRLCTLQGLRDELARRQRFPGRGKLRLAVAEMTGETTHSGYERLGRRLLRADGCAPTVAKPLAVEVDGRLEAEIDIPFDDVLYGVEIDGPHHLVAAVAAADRARDRRLKRVGWTIDRFFWFELDDRPQWFVREVARQLAALRGRR